MKLMPALHASNKNAGTCTHGHMQAYKVCLDILVYRASMMSLCWDRINIILCIHDMLLCMGIE